MRHGLRTSNPKPARHARPAERDVTVENGNQDWSTGGWTFTLTRVVPLVLCLVAGCGSVSGSPANAGGTGGGGAGSSAGIAGAGAHDAGAEEGGSGGASFETLRDPTCVQVAEQGFPPCGPTSPSGPCRDGRLACQDGAGTCIGTACCTGCVDANGSCVSGASTSTCGGSGYDCHTCVGSSYPDCPLDSDGIDHVCAKTNTPPPLGELNNATCSSPTRPSCTNGDGGTECVDGHTACTTSSGGKGACTGVYCCLGCIDSQGRCRTGNSASGIGVGGITCAVAAQSMLGT